MVIVRIRLVNISSCLYKGVTQTDESHKV